MSFTKGQWFAALNWYDRTTNNFLGTVLLVDSEGTGNPLRTAAAPSTSSDPKAKAKAAVGNFDGKLFTLVQLESTVQFVGGSLGSFVGRLLVFLRGGCRGREERVCIQNGF